MEYLRWAQPKQAQTIQLEQTLKILWLKNGRKNHATHSTRKNSQTTMCLK